jgi:hypothetical protein
MIWFSQLVLQEQERPIPARYQGSKRKTGKTYYNLQGWRESWFSGDMKEKLIPICSRYTMLFKDMLPNEKIEDYILKGIIQIAPLAFVWEEP